MSEIESNLEERVFAALSDSRRRQLLEKLALGESKTTTELASELPITRQGVAKHLNILAQAELVQAERSGRETHYSFNPQPLVKTTAWIAAITEQWDRRLRKLEDYLLSQNPSEEQQNDTTK
ncbi:metalloregulator ArsR/SmtB family transcription factor [Chloroflexi bacterium TSY]|nr:metalloregulator ArsR/SmtB family transcription factor [Chloroflexi bacterium TSY]